jgi:O-succinylbenzoate synthase
VTDTVAAVRALDTEKATARAACWAAFQRQVQSLDPRSPTAGAVAFALSEAHTRDVEALERDFADRRAPLAAAALAEIVRSLPRLSPPTQPDGPASRTPDP